MRIGKAGTELLKTFEGLRLEAYLCPAGVWTIGYGHTDGVKAGDKVDEAAAGALLRDDLAKFERCVSRAIVRPMNQNQFDAFVCLAFNIGCGAFAGSTAARRFNADLPPKLVTEAMKRWNKAGGKVLAGLVRRREAEAALFLKEPEPFEV